MLKLHLGCGSTYLPGFVNIDIAGRHADLFLNLEDCSLPYANNSVDLIVSSHFLEHLHNSIGLMNELYRVAKPDSLMIHQVPHGACDVADEDPTHIRRYYPGSFQYFQQGAYQTADYGCRANWINTHVIISYNKTRAEEVGVPPVVGINFLRNIAEEITFVSKAVKPIPAPDAASPWEPSIISRVMPKRRSILLDIPLEFRPPLQEPV